MHYGNEIFVVVVCFFFFYICLDMTSCFFFSSAGVVLLCGFFFPFFSCPQMKEKEWKKTRRAGEEKERMRVLIQG